MREALADKRTYTIYPPPAGSRGVLKYVPYQILLVAEIFLEGGGVYEKGSKGKKVLLQDMQIFFIFLKLIFDRICIPPPKKIGVYRTSAVRSFACPSRRHTFSSRTGIFIRLISEL